MNKVLLFCAVSLLTACTTVPVKQQFPEAPAVLLAPCDKLDIIGKDKVLFSEFLTTVVGNYTKFHSCAAQNAAWKEWYTENKKIFEETNK